MASFGALITILTLALDVFAQQVLSTQYQNTLVPASSLQFPSNILRSENYTISSDADNESGKTVLTSRLTDSNAALLLTNFQFKTESRIGPHMQQSTMAYWLQTRLIFQYHAQQETAHGP
jgi:hypothetical protein